MIRKKNTLPVNAKMYRHFAVVTLLLTGTLAIFASGENERVERERLEAKDQEVAEANNKREQAPKLAMTKEAERKTQSRSRSTNHSFSANFGVPMDKVGAEAQSIGNGDWSPEQFKPNLSQANIPPGISATVWEDLSPEQKERAWTVFGDGTPRLTEEELLQREKEMIAASRIRARR